MLPKPPNIEVGHHDSINRRSPRATFRGAAGFRSLFRPITSPATFDRTLLGGGPSLWKSQRNSRDLVGSLVSRLGTDPVSPRQSLC